MRNEIEACWTELGICGTGRIMVACLIGLVIVLANYLHNSLINGSAFPLVGSIALDAKIFRYFIDGEPPVFHTLIPFTELAVGQNPAQYIKATGVDDMMRHG